jgi:hypothetical protein
VSFGITPALVDADLRQAGKFSSGAILAQERSNRSSSTLDMSSSSYTNDEM